MTYLVLEPKFFHTTMYSQPLELVLFHVISICIKCHKGFYYPHLLNNYLFNYSNFSGLTLRDANNFIELLVTVNTTPQPHQRFPENLDFNVFCHEIKDVLLKLAIRAEQMSEDLSQLMNDAVRKVTLEDMMKI